MSLITSRQEYLSAMTGIYTKIVSIRSLTVVIFLVFIALCLLLTENSSALIGIEEGDIPKKIELVDIHGDLVDVSKLFGKKPVIIVFWELSTDKSFLNYSLDELRFLNEFYEKYHTEKGLEIVGIFTPEEENDMTESEENALESLIKTNGIKFPVLIDRGFESFREYGVIALPSTIMVNKAGKIMFIYPSFPLAAQPLFSKKIDELVGIAREEPEEEEQVVIGPDSKAKRLYRYSLQMYKRGLVEQSLSPLTKSMEMDPEFTWSRNLMGIILWKRGLFVEAVKEFNHALALDNNNVAARLNLTILMIEKENYKEAEKMLITSPRNKDLVLRAHHLLGLVYKKTKRNDLAIREYEKAYKIITTQSSSREETVSLPLSLEISILNDLSQLYVEQGDFENAVKLLREALKTSLGIENRTGKAIFGSVEFMVYE
jgi:tetratricopeptide (TPR) repeat protein